MNSQNQSTPINENGSPPDARQLRILVRFYEGREDCVVTTPVAAFMYHGLLRGDAESTVLALLRKHKHSFSARTFLAITEELVEFGFSDQELPLRPDIFFFVYLDTLTVDVGNRDNPGDEYPHGRTMSL